MSGSQKFIARNRAPRVQIEYDVELYGAEKKVQLPFVMGVLSDLAGKSEQPPVADRKFLEIDVDTFDERMKAMAPRAAFTVPNTLTGEGNMAVDLTFESMDDFSPAAIAAKVPGLAPLLEARRQLDDLMAYMDGKSGAEALIEHLLAEPALLKALGGGETAASDMEVALQSLRARMPAPEAEDDATDRTLAALAATPAADAPSEASLEDVLGGIERRDAEVAQDRTEDVLAGIERREGETVRDEASDVLAGIERREKTEASDEVSDVLAGIDRREETVEEDTASDVLAAIERREEAPEANRTDDILSGLERREITSEDDVTAHVLASVERRDEDDRRDEAPDILAGIERRDDAPEADAPSSILSAVERAEDVEEKDRTDDVLAGIEALEEAVTRDRVEDVLAGLDRVTETEEPDELSAVLAGVEATDTADPEDRLDDVLASLDTDEPEREDAGDVDDILADLGHAAAENGADPAEVGSDLDDLLNGLGGHDDTTDDGSDAFDDLDALLADLDGEGESLALDHARQVNADVGDVEHDVSTAGLPVREETPSGAPDYNTGEDDLDALLADLGGEELAADTDPGRNDAPDDLDALLSDVDTSGPDAGEEAGDVARRDTLQDAASGRDEPLGDLDDLLAELGAAEVGADAESHDLDALLADLTDDAGSEGAAADLDDLLAGMGTTELGDETTTAELFEASAPEARAGRAQPAQSPYGTISAPQPERAAMNRSRFRMALFGDFTGRASRGSMETGDALAARKPILLDVDTVEDVIEGFGTTLTLPIGRDGAGIEVKLGGLDDLHPDELYEKVEIFEAISGLRQQLSVGSMVARATEQVKGWAQEFGTPVKLPKRSAAISVPPDLKLSDFQALIGDTRGTLTKPTPAEDLIARIVGPHVVKAPDAGAAEMLKAVDEALSSAMRLVLHHPEFQAVESTWRSLDMLARRTETDASLEIVLYDVSAEELAADLSAGEDLAQSGFFRLLTDVMDPEEGDGGFSALFGLYTFEETPPHAQLLGRIGQVAAHVDAPFFAAISPAYLETPKEERHTLVATAWDGLRGLPQAAYLGVASPRFMLRKPYGPKSDPCYEFDFEEFTPREGLRGLLWANPVVLVAILLAATYRKDGRAMELGSLMTLGDIPFTYVIDRYGDQVALPCTERNLTSDAAQATLGRGYMPVLSMKGRNEVRLGSFRSLGGGEIAGPWSDAAPPRPAPPQASLAMEIAAGAAAGAAASADARNDDDPLADLDALLDTGDEADAGDALDLLGSDDDDGQSLDDLLASFADDDDATGDDDDMDPELAALLEGL